MHGGLRVFDQPSYLPEWEVTWGGPSGYWILAKRSGCYLVG